MKKIILSFGIMLVTLIIFTPASQADDVGALNIFASGEAAVAADVNKNFADIKTAVNTKQNRVGGTCPAGQYMTGVNADGSVACTTIVDGSGSGLDADTLDGVNSTSFVRDTGDSMTGTYTINGDVIANNLEYSSGQTRYYQISHMDLVPYTNGYTFYHNDPYLRYIDSGSQFWFAPVHLPHGAVITRVDAYTYDASTTNYISWNINGYGNGGSGGIALAGAYGTAAGNPGDQILADTSITNETIDNNSNFYYFRIAFYKSDSTDSLRFSNARITYTVYDPLP